MGSRPAAALLAVHVHVSARLAVPQRAASSTSQQEQAQDRSQAVRVFN
jgi:hypothetical protein